MATSAPAITESEIAALVSQFYARARRDPTIGPVFEAAVDDWDEHLAKLCDFWSSVMLTTGREAADRTGILRSLARIVARDGG
jgi:hemoglobin